MPSEETGTRRADLIDLALNEGALPGCVEIGDVFERVAMRMRDGRRWRIIGRPDHTLIKITAVPGGRRRMFSYVKVNPRPMGNGRADHGEERCDLLTLARHYSLVSRDAH